MISSDLALGTSRRADASRNELRQEFFGRARKSSAGGLSVKLAILEKKVGRLLELAGLLRYCDNFNLQEERGDQRGYSLPGPCCRRLAMLACPVIIHARHLVPSIP